MMMDNSESAHDPSPTPTSGADRKMTITPEMVEASAKEFERHAWPDCPWESIHESGRERYRAAAHDALVAAVAAGECKAP